MPQRTREEANNLVTKFEKRGGELVGEARMYERAERFVKFAWAFGMVIFGIAGWTFKVQWDQAHLTEELAKSDSKIRALEEYRASQTIIELGLQNSIATNRKDINAIQELLAKEVPKIDEMCFMKDHGISNHEDFQRRNGYPPPGTNDH